MRPGEGVTPPTSNKPPLFEVAKDVKLEGSPPTFDRITKNGKITVGVKEDQPGLGYKDATTGKRSGFDIDIARWIAASLGYSEDKIEFKAIPSANREQAIVNGDVDYYVGTYSITDKRKAVIDFAGPLLRHRPGPARPQERRHHQEREGPQGQDRLLGDRIHPRCRTSRRTSPPTPRRSASTCTPHAWSSSSTSRSTRSPRTRRS